MRLFLLLLLVGFSLEAAASPYEQVKAFMAKVVQDHPESATIFDLGLSNSGQVIQGLKIGDGPVHELIVATHHGNEYGSTEVAKAAAASFAEKPLGDSTVYVIPVLNISGYNAGVRNERAHGSSYDPNRDYPGPCGTEGPYKLKSTAALARFIDTENIITLATLHTFEPAVVYPWSFSERNLSTEYDDVFLELVQAAVYDSGYSVGNSAKLVYPAIGVLEDYAFWKHGIWSILFELGYSHTPNQESLAKMIKVNVLGLRRMLAIAPPQRALNHNFNGECDKNFFSVDRHEE